MGKCGEIYRRLYWINHGKKFIVWRCVSGLENTALACNSRTVIEDLLKDAVVKAINDLLGQKNDFLEVLLPIDKQGANLLFQLINKRFEKNSTIITTNQPFSKWSEVFSDITLANAILDRLIHHSSIIKITGPSYRLKGKIELLEAKKKYNN